MRSEKVLISLYRHLATVCISVVVGVGAQALAADADSGRLVGQANKLVAAGKYDEAFKIYDDVGAKLTDSAELAYNRGVAYYRKGDRAKAVEQFTKALLTRDIKLEARTKFNLGNCAYGDALDKQDDLKRALDKLKVAISHYKDAIAADPNDNDAKVNIETAQLLMKHLLDQEKKRQEEQKKNPSSQPESQPEQPQSQPSSQPESDQKDQQDKPQKDKQDKKQGNSKDQQQQEKQGEEKQQQGKDEQAKEEQDKKLEAQQQQGKEGEDDKDKQSEQAKAAQAQMREMPREEAEKLLQMIRDREQQRREAQLRLLQGQMVPVEKDW